MSDQRLGANFINRQSFIELDARERATAIFDAGTSRELVGPFDRVESPWLEQQGVMKYTALHPGLAFSASVQMELDRRCSWNGYSLSPIGSSGFCSWILPAVVLRKWPQSPIRFPPS